MVTLPGSRPKIVMPKIPINAKPLAVIKTDFHHGFV